jgi:hypothetical protein
MEESQNLFLILLFLHTLHCAEKMGSFHTELSNGAWQPGDTDEAWEVEKQLHRTIIPAFARMIENDFGIRREKDLDGEELTYRMHMKGIPMRHLGRIMMLLKGQHPREAVITEMVSRLLKMRIRKECCSAVSKGKGLSDKAARERLVSFLSLAFGRY